MIKFLKKFWGLLLAIIGFIFAIVTFKQIGKNKQKAKDAKDLIKKTENEFNDIEVEKKKIIKQAEELKKNINTSTTKIKELEKAVNNIHNNNTDVNVALEHLRNLVNES